MKKLLTILFAVALGLNLSAQVPDYVPTDGLVAWWPMNGNVHDAMGSLDGFNQGGIETYGPWGQIGQALELPNGDDYIDLPTGGVSEEGGVTLAFWVWLELPVEGSAPLIDRTEVSNNLWSLSYEQSSETVHFITRNSDGSGYHNLSTWSPPEAQWVHVTSVYRAQSSLKELHVDGSLVGSELAPLQGFAMPMMRLGEAAEGTWNSNCRFSEVGIWNRALTEEEILAFYNAQLPVPGCTDMSACNFNSEANEDDGSCIYPLFGDDCEDGGAACGEGTIWDANIQSCIVSDFCQEDLDGDGVIGVNDLMQLLSMFGMDCSVWTCGDPVNYHGYDYATVQIGEQCWFAENGRFLPHVSPPDLGSEDDGEPHAYVYGYIGADPMEAKQSIQYQEAGALYNQNAVMEWDLCPSGWHVPEANEVISLSDLFGGTGSIGGALKTTGTIQAGDGAWNEPNTAATNASGFSAIPGGARNHNEIFVGWSSFGYWRTTTPENGEGVPWHFCLAFFDGHLTNNCSAPSIQGREGYAVRCLKDTE